MKEKEASKSLKLINESVLEIAGQQVFPGETKDIKLKISETYVGVPASVPVRVIRGTEKGPKVFLTGGVHGDELAGVGIIRDLLYDCPPQISRGSLICVPVVNILGLENQTRYLPDRRDLNRCFPGIPEGSPSSRLAHLIFSEIISKCDFGIDFHSASVRRTNYPNVRADMRNPAVRNLARAFGCELIVDSKGPEGSLRRTAVKKGIPTIILEAGEVWKIEPGVVEVGIRGCNNVFKSLGMVEGEIERPLFQITVEKTTWVRADRGGFLGFHAIPGDLVRKGQGLATNFSIFGRERNVISSPMNGIVLGMTTMPAVKPGEPVYHIAALAEKTFNRIRRKIEESSDASLFARIRDDLSTSVTVPER